MSAFALLRVVAALGAPALTWGCGRDPAPDADSATTAGAPAAVAAGGAPAAGCPRTGHWTICSVRDRIERAGLAPFDSVVERGLPALGPTPTVYRVNKAALAAYVFPDSLARVRGARLLDSTKFVSSTLPLTVLTEATVIENDNLLALLFSKNDHQRERVADALTAGPPQR
ncbi:MAG: hypothetical protein ABIP93_05890 [Gemmatimonadaceae bacterium]